MHCFHEVFLLSTVCVLLEDVVVAIERRTRSQRPIAQRAASREKEREQKVKKSDPVQLARERAREFVSRRRLGTGLR